MEIFESDRLLFVLASVSDEENDFIYRLETDTQAKNLAGVLDFCAELGGYPIYAYNAYEWQIIQGIAYGLFSSFKQENFSF